MDPRCWGPDAWHVLHGLPWRCNLRLAEPFVGALSDVLPCIHCRQSFRALLRMLPVDDRQPITLAEWAWRAHNAVNEKLGKPRYEFAAVLGAPLADADWQQAISNLASFVALNYPAAAPSAGQRRAHGAFFQLLGALAGFPTSDLDAALEDREQLYAWLRAARQLPDDRALIEQVRVSKR